MKIGHLRTNQITNPLGFEFERLCLSWITETGGSNSVFQNFARVEVALDSDFNQIVFDSGKKQDID
ncbi:MAG: alfa-L-rhamnosidase RamA, partial [Neobacillus sp.]|nr:alfa-L-rhamnosidase RamA [Neobacillus sp.]